jgi:hypothetical protein
MNTTLYFIVKLLAYLLGFIAVLLGLIAVLVLAVYIIRKYYMYTKFLEE